MEPEAPHKTLLSATDISKKKIFLHYEMIHRGFKGGRQSNHVNRRVTFKLRLRSVHKVAIRPRSRLPPSTQWRKFKEVSKADEETSVKYFNVTDMMMMKSKSVTHLGFSDEMKRILMRSAI